MTSEVLCDLSRQLGRFSGPWRNVGTQIADACLACGVRFDLRVILSCLRDMAYLRPSGGQTVAAALEEWRGTCSTKHLALHDLLTRLGYAPTLKMACFRVGPDFPGQDAQLRSELGALAVYDVHNFLTCDLGNGEIILDVTFPRALKRHGFIVTEDWDGSSSFALACTPDRVEDISVETALERKSVWLRELNIGPAMQLRERVILEFGRIMAGLGPSPSRAKAIEATVQSLA